MVDNYVTNSGAGGNTYSSDDIGGIHYPRVKVTWGADGTANETAAATPLPVVQTGALPAGTNNIGDIDVLTVPADPFGANADVSSATGSISAKLRFLAAGIAGATSLPAGTNNIGDVDVLTLPAIPAGTNNIGDVDVLTLPALVAGTANIGRVVPIGAAADGLLTFRSLDLDETEEEVKATAGTVYAMWVTNTATATRWVKFYNATAATVVVGTTTPAITIGIPGNTTDDIAGNFGPGGVGIAFSTAITVAATTGVADADVGAPGVNDVIVNIFYV